MSGGIERDREAELYAELKGAQMSMDIENIAFRLWKADADRAAPNVGKHLIPEMFAVCCEEIRARWLGLASAVVTCDPNGAAQIVEYTNWRGVTALRVIRPIRMWWGKTEWHPEQWVLTAYDCEKNCVRDFAWQDMRPVANPATSEAKKAAIPQPIPEGLVEPVCPECQNTGLTWSLELYQQASARLPGSDEEFKSYLLGFDYAAEIALRQRAVVKPLVWEGHSDDQRSGDYVITPSYGQGPKRLLLARGSKLVSWHDDMDEAKAAGQDDHEACTLAAIDVQPDPRGQQIAQLVEAAEATLAWDQARNFPIPYRVRDPIFKAIAAAKGGAA